MRASFVAPLAGLGLLLAAITAGYFAASASNGPLAARYGGVALLISGCLLAGLGASCLAAALTWWMVPVCGILVGVGSGLIDAAVNAHASLRRGVSYMGWLHASWALGAALGPPLIVASLAATRSWRAAFAVLGLCFLLCAMLAFQQRGTWTTMPSAELSTRASINVPPSQYRRATVGLAALFLLGAGMEATTGNWSYSQLTLGRGITLSLASLGASLFWLGLAGGRVALGLVGGRLRSTLLLDISITTSVIGATMYWFFPATLAALVALPLVGLALSLVFPLLLSLTPGRVGTAMTSHAVGYGLAAGTLGGGVVPALIGVALQNVGLWSLGPALTLIASGLLVVHLINRRS